MIKLTRSEKPSQLTNESIRQMTIEFKESGTHVWRKTYIKSSLLNLSYNKCCYCECNISEESKYMEIDHFYPKDIYPDQVVEWDNLLPSCKRCNVNKGVHDPNEEQIINPFLCEPKEHLFFKNYRLKHKSEVGRNTIDILCLNETDRLVLPRFQIGNAVENSLETILDRIKDYATMEIKTSRSRSKIVSSVKSLLKQGHPHRDYAATVATTLLNDENFYECKRILLEIDLWDEELEEIENILTITCLNVS